MLHPASAKHKSSVIIPYRKIKVDNGIERILHLPGGQRFIICSWDGSFRVWDLDKGTQVGEEWVDKELVEVIALSPDGETVATGSEDGAVKLWNVDTGKVIKTLTGHTTKVGSVCWSLDGRGRVLSGSFDGTFIVWDVKSGETVIGPIDAGSRVLAVCYSPDAKMIATCGDGLKIWDTDTGELLKTFKAGNVWCLAWTLDGKTLIAGGNKITKFDTATWAVLDVRENFVDIILLSPSERILASTSSRDKTVQLWNLETNQPIGTPLHHEHRVNSVTFAADGKFLVTGCNDDHLYTWDVSAIVKEAGLPSDVADATPQPAPKIKGAPRIPPGFFNDALREANLRTRLSQSHGSHNDPTPAPRQNTLGPLSSFWRRSKPHGTTQHDTRSRPLSWTRNIVSGMMRKRDRSDIEMREPPEAEVPYTAGKPRDYHARKKKPVTSSSRPPNTHTTQQSNAATQGSPPSSHVQQPPPTATASTLLAVAGTAPTTGTTPSPHITIAGWRARLVGWLCCVPIQNTNGQP